MQRSIEERGVTQSCNQYPIDMVPFTHVQRVALAIVPSGEACSWGCELSGHRFKGVHQNSVQWVQFIYKVRCQVVKRCCKIFSETGQKTSWTTRCPSLYVCEEGLSSHAPRILRCAYRKLREAMKGLAWKIEIRCLGGAARRIGSSNRRLGIYSAWFCLGSTWNIKMDQWRVNNMTMKLEAPSYAAYIHLLLKSCSFFKIDPY